MAKSSGWLDGALRRTTDERGSAHACSGGKRNGGCLDFHRGRAAASALARYSVP